MADVDWLRKFRAALNAALPGNSQWDLGDDWIKRSLGACPDDLMKQIVEDNRRGGDILPSPSSGFALARRSHSK